MQKKAIRTERAATAVAPSLLSEDDLHLFNEGTHYRLYEHLGAHPLTAGDGTTGTYFAVWAPNAERVAVIGDFNGWSDATHPLRPRGGSGIWEGFHPGIGTGAVYKYRIHSRVGGYSVDKADPFARHTQVPPETASVVWQPDHGWRDEEWMSQRRRRQSLTAPCAVYEVHIGSWTRAADGGWLNYRDLGEKLAAYVTEMGFSHVEILPVMEHPFYGSWGYQCTGYFAPTSRYGRPEDLMAMIDLLHQNGIGVILDWVPSHFPKDEFALGYFDGTHLFEHADPRKGLHPDWDSLIFNYGRNEVRSFLVSSAMYWLDKYHADGLRVDAVASMLYLDYSREAGEWIPNQHGGRENIEAVDFLRRLNEATYGAYPDTQTSAEESTAWPMVSRPAYLGGLGFGLKWDMGWMHDTLSFIADEPIHRKYRHHALTFRMVYAFTENFVLPLSHDEVVHGKGSLLGKMPGDDWQKFANLRLLLGYMYAQPGKKLLFMGGEFGQRAEWNHDGQLEWHLLRHDAHRGVQRWVRDLNTLYRAEPCLHELDCSPQGFEWIDCNDADQSTLSFLRRGTGPDEVIVIALNFTPVPRHTYRLGVPWGGHWRELLNSDASLYGGSGQGNLGGIDATPVAHHGRPSSLEITLPPLALVAFKGRRGPMGGSAALPGVP